MRYTHKRFKANIKSWISFFKKVHRVVIFHQNAWLEPYFDRNPDLRKKAKNDFEKDFFKLMNKRVFWKSYRKCEKK